jgi:CheY-like chemotaxis protein
MSENLYAGSRPATILLVEDNDDDVELTRLGFKHSKLAVNLQHVENGEECMAYLRREGTYADAPTPDLIVLDLNLPRMDGREVLVAIDRDERLRHMPVVVLTSSSADAEVLTSYKCRCSSYIVKPVDFESFIQVIRTLADYWFGLVVLPTGVHERILNSSGAEKRSSGGGQT